MEVRPLINLYKILKDFPAMSRQLNCRGMLFTQYDCPQTLPKANFFVEYNFIAYVISGRRIFWKDGRKWDLKEGVCAFVKKGTHTAERLSDDEWCIMVFFIPDDFLSALTRENRNILPQAGSSGTENDHVLLLDVNELSQSIFQSMHVYFSQRPPENLVELKFKELVLSLLSNEKNEPLATFVRQLLDDRRQSLVEIMLNNYKFNLTVSQYASLACRSIPTFTREFKRAFHDTPAKWVTKKRIALASDLLENSSLKIWEIAHECGFENQTHFSRIFKQKAGCSPLQFRTAQKSR